MPVDELMLSELNDNMNKEEICPEEIHNDLSEDICEVSKDKSIFSRILRTIITWGIVFLIAFAIALCLNKFVITNAVIPSASMETTVMTGDRVIGFNFSYLFSDPERGDVIIFKYPDDESVLFIKRIIGLPGDKVQIIDGLVYINDSEVPLNESYVKESPIGSYGPYYVPEDYYFVLGDNRNVSNDSRYWKNTFVNRKKIVAKAIFRYYPNFDLIK